MGRPKIKESSIEGRVVLWKATSSWRKTTATNPELWKSENTRNRRYYDSTRSRHLSMQQIHKLIIEGYNIRVLDAKTREDITPKVLKQIKELAPRPRRHRSTFSS